MKVLIVSQWQWHGPARFARALKNVGCEVAGLCGKGDLLARTDFVDRFFYADTSDELDVLRTLDLAIRAFRPDLILPASDNFVRTLQTYRKRVEAGKIDLDGDLVDVLHRCSFPPEAETLLNSKTDLLNALAEKGVRIPPQRDLQTFGDADLFVQEHGYPVILKPDQGSASEGIRICRDEESLIHHLNTLVFGRHQRRYCIQKYLGNQTAVIHFVAKEGNLLAWNMAYRLRTHPGETGQTSAIQVIDNEEMLNTTRILCEMVGYNGMGAPQFVVEDEGRGKAYLMELNPRMGTYVHLWQTIGTDLADALVKAWSGQQVQRKPAEVGRTVALYPQETIRNPESEFIKIQNDVPVGDKGLLAAYELMIQARGKKQPTMNP